MPKIALKSNGFSWTQTMTERSILEPLKSSQIPCDGRASPVSLTPKAMPGSIHAAPVMGIIMPMPQA